jgi:peptidoglycan/LPS O-acetylase OafA/YrhL
MLDMQPRYRTLGGFRFALALMVVLQHFQHLLPAADRTVFSRAGSGAIAVAVFFVISGFVVAEALASFYAGRAGAFLANRVLRLGPPYLAALALSVCVHAALWARGDLVLWDYAPGGSPVAPLRLLGGLLGLVPGLNPRWFGQEFEYVPYVWSLRLEMAFYLAAAGVMWIAWRRRAVWPVVLAIVVGLLVSMAYLILLRRPSALSTAPMFLVGVVWFAREQRPGPATSALLAVCVAVAAAGFASWRQHGAPWLLPQLLVLGALLGLFAWFTTRSVAGTARRIDRRLGDLSYPLYLNHYAVGIAAASLAPALGWPLYAGMLLVSLLVAAVAERLVERPLRRWRDRIRAVGV